MSTFYEWMMNRSWERLVTCLGCGWERLQQTPVVLLMYKAWKIMDELMDDEWQNP